MTRFKDDVFNAAVCKRRLVKPPGTAAVLIGAFCGTSVVVESQAVTATINVEDAGIPSATLILPRRLNATPEDGFKIALIAPVDEQSAGEEIA
jgi:hypothetical protein